ncbi:MAG: Gfo/Idh/MocA family oxidoreductase [Pseudomonadota bacterium]
MKPLDIAVVGAGVIGRRHMELLAQSPRARLCAIVDPSPATAALAAQSQVPHYPNLQVLFAQARPDGAILATPNALHVPGALACAAHGVPALIEKPLADSVEAGEQLARALEALRVPMLVGHHRRHSAALRAAHEVIRRGTLGRLVSVMGSALFHKADSYFEGGPWRREPGGGPVLINLIHDIDNLRMLCGDVTSVQAMASNAVRGFAVEDTAVINLRFANGALGTFTLSDAAAAPRSWEQTSGENADYPHHPGEDCYFLAGTRGSLAVPTLRTWVYPGAASWWMPFDTAQLALDATDPLAVQLGHFCDVVERRAEPLVTVASALESLRVVQAVRRAIASGGCEQVAGH